MQFSEIFDETRKGRYVVFVDDKQNASLTPKYVEEHFVTLVDSVQEGKRYCQEIQAREREASGRALTRYRICGNNTDEVCMEDLTEDDILRIVDAMPMDQKYKHTIKKGIKESG